MLGCCRNPPCSSPDTPCNIRLKLGRLLTTGSFWEICDVWRFRDVSKWRSACAVCAGMSGGEPSSAEDQIETLVSDLSRRDLNNRLTQMCCQMGCRKSDLTYLCWGTANQHNVASPPTTHPTTDRSLSFTLMQLHHFNTSTAFSKKNLCFDLVINRYGAITTGVLIPDLNNDWYALWNWLLYIYSLNKLREELAFQRWPVWVTPCSTSSTHT